MQGIIKRFIQNKYYGFITGEDRKDYFFHGSQLMFSGDEIYINVGDPVEFIPATTDRGLQAHNVKLLEV